MKREIADRDRDIKTYTKKETRKRQRQRQGRHKCSTDSADLADPSGFSFPTKNFQFLRIITRI